MYGRRPTSWWRDGGSVVVSSALTTLACVAGTPFKCFLRTPRFIRIVIGGSVIEKRCVTSRYQESQISG